MMVSMHFLWASAAPMNKKTRRDHTQKMMKSDATSMMMRALGLKRAEKSVADMWWSGCKG
jgi:hypothetical protein